MRPPLGGDKSVSGSIEVSLLFVVSRVGLFYGWVGALGIYQSIGSIVFIYNLEHSKRCEKIASSQLQPKNLNHQPKVLTYTFLKFILSTILIVYCPSMNNYGLNRKVFQYFRWSVRATSHRKYLRHHVVMHSTFIPLAFPSTHIDNIHMLLFCICSLESCPDNVSKTLDWSSHTVLFHSLFSLLSTIVTIKCTVNLCCLISPSVYFAPLSSTTLHCGNKCIFFDVLASLRSKIAFFFRSFSFHLMSG